MKVYISEPLTGCSERKVFNQIKKICESFGYSVFLPHLNTDPLIDPDNPSAEEVWKNDHNEVTSSDLLIAYVGKPSLGVGSELEMARQAGVKIILWWFEGEKVSRLVKGNPAVTHQIIAKECDDLLKKLEKFLKKINGTNKIKRGAGGRVGLNYPYLPEGRAVEYVSDDNKYMQAAKKLAKKSICLKLKTGAVIVKNNQIIAKGSNTGEVVVKECPREKLKLATGTGYEHCQTDCRQGGHAEAMAVEDAVLNQVDCSGADLYLYGHWWCCEPCWASMIKAGINHVYLNEKTKREAENYQNIMQSSHFGLDQELKINRS